MWVGGEYVSRRHPSHRPGRYASWDDVHAGRYADAREVPAKVPLTKEEVWRKEKEDQIAELRDALNAAKSDEGWAYIIKNPWFPDYLKFGFSGDCGWSRAKSMKTAAPGGGYVVVHQRHFENGRAAESIMHDVYAHFREPGGEWFYMPDAEHLAVATLMGIVE
jgi:hypothetical protein